MIQIEHNKTFSNALNNTIFLSSQNVLSASLVSFSGFDELPICILNKLKELGYNTSQVN